jgi:hypothetical protein
MTTLLLDAVYIACEEACCGPHWERNHGSWPNAARTASMADRLGSIWRFLNRVWTAPVLPYASIFEASVVGAIVDHGDLTPPDPFSTESTFLSPLWPRE